EERALEMDHQPVHPLVADEDVRAAPQYLEGQAGPSSLLQDGQQLVDRPGLGEVGGPSPQPEPDQGGQGNVLVDEILQSVEGIHRLAFPPRVRVKRGDGDAWAAPLEAGPRRSTPRPCSRPACSTRSIHATFVDSPPRSTRLVRRLPTCRDRIAYRAARGRPGDAARRPDD